MPAKIDRIIMKIADSYESVKASKFGIYGYFTQSGECLYIGIDSNIDKNSRHNHHYSPSKKKEQKINRYIQSDAAKTVSYSVMYLCRDQIEMENLETILILLYKSLGQCRFNGAISIDKEMSAKLIEGLTTIHRN